MRKMLAAVSRVLSGAAQKPVSWREPPGIWRERGGGWRTRRAVWLGLWVRGVLPEPLAFVLPPGDAFLAWPGEERLLGRRRRPGAGGGFTMAAWRSAAAPGAGLGVPQICPCILLQTEKRVFLDFSSLQLTTLAGPLI